jgi:hypothetical protein
MSDNLLVMWWKSRKYFKPPHIHINISWLPLSKFCWCIFDGWKYKYGYYQWVEDPVIYLKFCDKFKIKIRFNWIKDDNDYQQVLRSRSTWEAIIQYYSGKPIEKVVLTGQWEGAEGLYCTLYENLTKKGKQIYDERNSRQNG